MAGEVSAMPETANYSQPQCAHIRILYVIQQGAPGYVVSGWWQCGDCSTRFVPESALLAAEARAKAMEDGPLDYMSGKCDRLKEQNAALRADLDALVPLARLAMLAREMYGMGELELDADLEGTAIKTEWDSLIAATDKARAILAREET